VPVAQNADVAQLVEQLIRNQQVVSSSLTVGSIAFDIELYELPPSQALRGRLFWRLLLQPQGMRNGSVVPDSIEIPGPPLNLEPTAGMITASKMLGSL
jgi:hypothetical protein